MPHRAQQHVGSITLPLVLGLACICAGAYAAAALTGLVRPPVAMPRWLTPVAAAALVAAGLALLVAAFRTARSNDATEGGFVSEADRLAASGDFSDPARLAPLAQRAPQAQVALKPRATRLARPKHPEAGAPVRAGPGITLIGILVVLVVLGVFHWVVFQDWRLAPAVPFEAGIASLSPGRIILVFIDLVILGTMILHVAGSSLRRQPPAMVKALLIATFLGAAALEGSGALRRTYVDAGGVLPGVAGMPQARTERSPRPGDARKAPAPTGVPPPPQTAARKPACEDAGNLLQAIDHDCGARFATILAERRGDLEARDERGMTALMLAVRKDRVDLAEALLKGAADANARIAAPRGEPRTRSGLAMAQSPELAVNTTPLMLAKSAAMTALLLRYGADPGLKNDYGWSAIFYHTRNGTPEMLTLLLGAGANINDTADVDPSHAGSTPLMWAAYLNRGPQLEELLRYRPRLDMRDRAGNTALDYATRFKHTDAIMRLKAAGA